MITANDIKTKGVRAIEENLSEYNEVFISVHGRPKYAVMTIEQYDEYRELELTKAAEEVLAEVKSGDYTESISDHIKEIRESID